MSQRRVARLPTGSIVAHDRVAACCFDDGIDGLDVELSRRLDQFADFVLSRADYRHPSHFLTTYRTRALIIPLLTGVGYTPRSVITHPTITIPATNITA